MPKRKRSIKQIVSSEENWDMAQINCAKAIMYKLHNNIRKRVPSSFERDCMSSDIEIIQKKLNVLLDNVVHFQSLRIKISKEEEPKDA